MQDKECAEVGMEIEKRIISFPKLVESNHQAFFIIVKAFMACYDLWIVSLSFNRPVHMSGKLMNSTTK